jgi:tRNA threonylcarbamoyladenosine biosynthesis protein TsaE
MKSYEVADPRVLMQGFRKLIHIDAYRLEKPEEIVRLGWEALVADPGNIVLVEWPEHIGGAMPADAQKITFSVVDENTREIGL